MDTDANGPDVRNGGSHFEQVRTGRSADGFVALGLAEWEGIVALEDPVERVRCFLVEGRERCLLVDTGSGWSDVAGWVRANVTKPVWVLLTHGHWDHIGSADAFDVRLAHLRYRADRLAAAERLRLRTTWQARLGRSLPELPRVQACPSLRIGGGERIDLGGLEVSVLAMEGHTTGDLVAWLPARGWLATGDLAYPGAIELTGPEADLGAYRRSLQLLASLDGVRRLGCGHEVSFAEPDLLQEIATSLELPDDALRDRTFAQHRFVFDGEGGGDRSGAVARTTTCDGLRKDQGPRNANGALSLS